MYVCMTCMTIIPKMETESKRELGAKLRQERKIMIDGRGPALTGVSKPSRGGAEQLCLDADDARQAALDVRLGLAHASTTGGFTHQSSIQEDSRNEFRPRLLIERALFRRLRRRDVDSVLEGSRAGQAHTC